MSDALPLPPRPNLGQYKKLARGLQAACKSTEPDAVLNWAAAWAEKIARLQGMEVAPEAHRQIQVEAERLAQRWRKFRQADERASQCTLARAQYFVALGHGFASWPKFARHLGELSLAHSPVSQFEAAAEAIVTGDSATLEALLRENPQLIRARSTREHRSTLLHYISANGIEDFRQKTPQNIVLIAQLLLQAGADVNAESDAYGGRSTTLGLTATSCHPEDAGVQIALLQLLLDGGSSVDAPDGGSTVNFCLHNGRGLAAEFLAQRGARLDLEGAAGVGRLDIVKTFFTGAGELRSPDLHQQMIDGFAWACQFGRTSVIEFLLHSGIDPSTKLRQPGRTGLHWAAYGGHVEAVKLLLERNAPLDAIDENFGGAPLDWALYGREHPSRTRPAESYSEVVALLTQAGAKPPGQKSRPD